MLDKASEFILKKFVKESYNKGYKIFYIDEFSNLIPKKYNIDKNNLLDFVKNLEEKGYISLKYTDEELFCLTALLKARIYLEDKLDTLKKYNKFKKLAIWVISLNFIFCFLACFLSIFIATKLL